MKISEDKLKYLNKKDNTLTKARIGIDNVSSSNINKNVNKNQLNLQEEENKTSNYND